MDVVRRVNRFAVSIAGGGDFSMVAFDAERARILSELEMTCRVANQMRLVLAKNELDPEARARARQVLDMQIPELKRLTNMLSALDDIRMKRPILSGL